MASFCHLDRPIWLAMLKEQEKIQWKCNDYKNLPGISEEELLPKLNLNLYGAAIEHFPRDFPG
jgi:hypothetical protein